MPAVFVLLLDDGGRLKLSQTVSLTSMALDITFGAVSGNDRQYLVALDNSQPENQVSAAIGFERGIALLTQDSNSDSSSFRVEPLQLQTAGLGPAELRWLREEIDAHLYTVENMRKNATEESHDAET